MNKSVINSLEPDATTLREMMHATEEMIINFLTTLPDHPAQNLAHTNEHIEHWHEPLPEQGTALEQLLTEIRERVIDCAVNTAGGTYQAYIPGGGIFAAGLAELIAAVSNRFVNVWAVAPCAVELEANVLQWLCQVMGYGEQAKGIFTSGGSLANFSAVVAARVAKLPEDFLKGTIYVSEQTHQSVKKSALLAGFPARNIRAIATDAQFRIISEAVLTQIEADRAEGLMPFMIVANAGTTNTGAVDDIAALAKIAQQEHLWLHVDAAYGGFFQLTERGCTLFQGIEQADSITLDPHKGMFLPYGTGCLLVRNGETLRKAHQIEAAYLQDLGESSINFTDYSPELTRSFRGLRVWLPLKLYGVNVFRAYLNEKLDLAQWACEQLKTIERLEIFAEPQLSIVAFRYAAQINEQGNENHWNKLLLQKVVASKKTFISSTTIAGKVVLRIAILSFRTHQKEVAATIEAIRAATKEVIEAEAGLSKAQT